MKGTFGKDKLETNCFIVFVSFYPEYFDESLNRLKRMLSNLNHSENTILVVSNNYVFNVKNINSEVESITFRFINGSNASWEFSAWDEGLKFIMTNYKIDERDTLIFANDTFCHHRSFTRFDEYCFTHSVKRYLNDDVVIGHIDKSPFPLLVKGIKVEKWISTFLFTAKYKTIKRTLPFSQCHIDDVEFKDGKISISRCDEKFNEYITNWLCNSWYKSGSQNKELIRNKAKAIVNEKCFSGRLKENSVDIISVYTESWMIYFRRLQVKMSNIRK
uniref:hypothetical protein n=1 Tax=Enterovibrio norvegicus TaxID=188144 RepID=UPI0024B21CDE|nr:hypothetical protein [Enterovibrio norvegicus]